MAPTDASPWGDVYELTYEYHSRKNRQRRANRREQDRKRRAKKVAAGQRPTGDQAALADLSRQRRLSRDALITLRWEVGFVWRGGLISGNGTYRRDPFTYQGLVSDEHPILKLFAASTRRAHALITGDTKAEATPTDSKLLALDCAYVESNKVMRRVLRAELDGVFSSWAAIIDAITARGVPLPNIAVGFELANGRVVNPHLVWLIDAAVPHTLNGRLAHQALYAAVLRSLTAELLDVGADPGGLANPARHKNPLSPLWDRQILAQEPYTLADLKAALPLAEATAKLKAAEAKRAGAPAAPIPQEHPDPEIAAGSNKVFVALARLARQRVAWYRDEGNGAQAEFLQELAAEALRLVPYSKGAERIAIATAECVATWTWTNYRARVPRKTLPPEERASRQAAGQAQAADRRRVETKSLIVGTALRLQAANGRAPTQEEIRLALAVAQTPRSINTISGHWPAVRAALVDAAKLPPVQFCDDKKGAARRPAVSPPLFGTHSPQASPPSAPPSVHPRSPQGAEAPDPSMGREGAETPCGPPGVLALTSPPATLQEPPPSLPGDDQVPW